MRLIKWSLRGAFAGVVIVGGLRSLFKNDPNDKTKSIASGQMTACDDAKLGASLGAALGFGAALATALVRRR